MYKRRWTGVALLALISAPGSLSAQERGEIGIAVGETPELVEIEDLDGNAVALSRFLDGKPVLFEFWATWCENCEALEPSMEAAHAAYGDQVEFVAVAVAVAQSRRRVRRHLEEHGVGWPTLWDARGAAVRAFLAPATSYVAIIDAAGTVVYTGIGPDQDIEAAVRMVLESQE